LDENALWFSNKKQEDIFLEDDLRDLLGDRLRLFLTDESEENAAGMTGSDWSIRFEISTNIFIFAAPTPWLKTWPKRSNPSGWLRTMS